MAPNCVSHNIKNVWKHCFKLKSPNVLSIHNDVSIFCEYLFIAVHGINVKIKARPQSHDTPPHHRQPQLFAEVALAPCHRPRLLCRAVTSRPAPPLLMHVSAAIFYVIKMSVLVTNGRECHFLALDYNLEFFCVRAAVCRAGQGRAGPGWADSGVGAAVFVCWSRAEGGWSPHTVHTGHRLIRRHPAIRW